MAMLREPQKLPTALGQNPIQVGTAAPKPADTLRPKPASVPGARGRPVVALGSYEAEVGRRTARQRAAASQARAAAATRQPMQTLVGGRPAVSPTTPAAQTSPSSPSRLRNALGTGLALARASLPVAAALTPSRLANGELTPEILAAYDRAASTGYTGTQTLPTSAVVPSPETRRVTGDGPRSRGQETLRRAGVTPDPSAGAGRGIGVSAPALQSFDRTDDVRRSIDTGVIPETLRDGRIWRSGNSYTGMDVKEGAAFVDARTGMNREPRGSVNTLPSLTNGMSSSLDNQLAAARSAAAARGDFERALRSFGGPGAQQSQQRTPAQEAMDTIQEMRSRGLRVTGTTFRSLVNDITRQRGNELDNQTVRRGQDIEMEEKDAVRRAIPDLRALRAEVWRRARGNARVAADMMYSMGLDGKSMFDFARDVQQFENDARESALRRFENFMDTDDNGNITEQGRARVQSAVDKAFPGFFNLTPAEQAAVYPQVEAELRLMQGANQTRDAFTWPAWIGGSRGRPQITSPLDGLQGGELGKAGLLDALLSEDVDMGDYRLRTGTGQEIFLPRGVIDQNTLEQLARRGVNVGLRNQ